MTKHELIEINDFNNALRFLSVPLKTFSNSLYLTIVNSTIVSAIAELTLFSGLMIDFKLKNCPASALNLAGRFTPMLPETTPELTK